MEMGNGISPQNSVVYCQSGFTLTEVQSWFEDRKKESRAKVNSQKSAVKLDVIPFSYDTTTLSNASESSSKLKGENVDLSELSYEAKSVKDGGAWYDVASFLNYRVLSTGELEASVRYAGFRKRKMNGGA